MGGSVGKSKLDRMIVKKVCEIGYFVCRYSNSWFKMVKG